jgi:hypothetical protein
MSTLITQTQVLEMKTDYLEAGKQRLQEEDLDGALDYFNQALELNPNHVACLNQAAKIYEMRKEYDRAIDCYQRIIALNPDAIGFQFILERLILKSQVAVKSGNCLKSKDFGSAEEESRRLSITVEKFQAEEKPIYLQFGFGDTPFPHFLNIDVMLVPKARNNIVAEMFDRVFLFPWLKTKLPLPDNSVDFIFHQDLFEHLPQMLQFVLLAETRRVLKPGCFHRINTPCIAASMQRKSDFAKGFDGVYTEEWTKHGHVNVITKDILEEMAHIVGYSKVLFNAKNASVAGVDFREYRPGPDRDQVNGNIFADLMK